MYNILCYSVQCSDSQILNSILYSYYITLAIFPVLDNTFWYLILYNSSHLLPPTSMLPCSPPFSPVVTTSLLSVSVIQFCLCYIH